MVSWAWGEWGHKICKWLSSKSHQPPAPPSHLMKNQWSLRFCVINKNLNGKVWFCLNAIINWKNEGKRATCYHIIPNHCLWPSIRLSLVSCFRSIWLNFWMPHSHSLLPPGEIGSTLHFIEWLSEPVKKKKTNATNKLVLTKNVLKNDFNSNIYNVGVKWYVLVISTVGVMWTQHSFLTDVSDMPHISTTWRKAKVIQVSSFICLYEASLSSRRLMLFFEHASGHTTRNKARRITEHEPWVISR